MPKSVKFLFVLFYILVNDSRVKEFPLMAQSMMRASPPRDSFDLTFSCSVLIEKLFFLSFFFSCKVCVSKECWKLL